MKDDLHKQLCDLEIDPDRSLVSQLLEIQEHQVDEPRSFAWVRNFHCLSPSFDEKSTRTSHGALKRLSRVPVEISGGDYIAVSYRWEDSPANQQQTSNYFVESGLSFRGKRAQVSDATLDRIIKYTNHIQVPVFWIDRECIDQQDYTARASAVQVMDLVYRCSRHPIAILTTNIKHQSDLDVLHQIVSGQMTSTTYPKGPRLKRRVSRQTLQRAVRLLTRLTRDAWWTRRWTFQEEYCSYRDMQLLIPHDLSLSKEKWGGFRDSIAGEVLVRIADFREQVTRFCLACSKSQLVKHKIDQANILMIHKRAESYTISHKYDHTSWTGRPTKTLSTRILADIGRRGAQNAEDVLAIVANCCGYSVRLDSEGLVGGGQQSLSLNLLALSLLNGELLRSESRASLDEKIADFMGKQTFSDFDLPVDGQELTFMKQCRLPSVRICREGIKTRGYLWEVQGAIPTQDFPYERWANASPTKYDKLCLSWLSARLEELAFHELVRQIDDYLESDTAPNSKGSERLEKAFRDTVACVAQAVEERQGIAAACLSDHPKTWGIFVTDDVPNLQARFVFTASESAKFSTLVERHRSPAKYVSLEVELERGHDRRSQLMQIKRWINGLTFPGNMPPSEHIFKWPDVLQKNIRSSLEE